MLMAKYVRSRCSGCGARTAGPVMNPSRDFTGYRKSLSVYERGAGTSKVTGGAGLSTNQEQGLHRLQAKCTRGSLNHGPLHQSID